MWLAATNGFSLGSGLAGTHCNRKRRLNAAVLRARLLLSPHSSHLESAPGVSGSLWFSHAHDPPLNAVVATDAVALDVDVERTGAVLQARLQVLEPRYISSSSRRWLSKRQAHCFLLRATVSHHGG